MATFQGIAFSCSEVVRELVGVQGANVVVWELIGVCRLSRDWFSLRVVILGAEELKGCQDAGF